MHGRCDPHFFVSIFFPIHRYRSVSRCKVKQQSFDCDPGIIDLLAGDLPKLVAYLAAVAVDTEAYTVDKAVVFSIDLHGRQILQILGYGTRILSHTYILCKVISRSGGKIQDLLRDF